MSERGEQGAERLPDVRSTAVEVDPERRPGANALARVSDAPVPHLARFQFMRGALVAVALCALGAAGLLLAAGDRGTGAAAWSRWEPRERGVEGAAEIARHVKGQYRLDSGEQIVDVQGGPLALGEIKLTIAVREPGGNIAVREGDAVAYRLCGMGRNCAISVGSASTQRHLLLRREALELALYTFRYVDDVDDVVVFMPPRKGETPRFALLFRRADVAPLLERPLAATLTAATPTVSTVAAAPDRPLVERLTLPNLFQFSLTQGTAEQRVFLVLARPAPGGQPRARPRSRQDQ